MSVARQPVSGKLRSQFECSILPHSGAAYSLARWMLRHPQDAEDALQESILKAYRGFHAYEGGNARAWLLTIVRNTCLTAIERRRSEDKVVLLASAMQRYDGFRDAVADPALPQDAALIAEETRRHTRAAVLALPLAFREVLILREYHDLSYREIADIVGAPAGTVMSRLARARERLAAALAEDTSTTSAHGVEP
jgi:RNA polymerase sigma-70 factor (ECF subfamily)